VTIQNYVKRLRHALGDAEHSTIVTRADGYFIRAGTADFDVTRFEDLHAQARKASQARDWAGLPSGWAPRWRCGAECRWRMCPAIC